MPKQKKPDRRAVAQQRANDLKVMRADVAGIDVGAEELFVCAPGPEEGLTQVMVFGTTTPELMKMAEWLKQWKVESVAMESTGVRRSWPRQLPRATLCRRTAASVPAQSAR